MVSLRSYLDRDIDYVLDRVSSKGKELQPVLELIDAQKCLGRQDHAVPAERGKAGRRSWVERENGVARCHVVKDKRAVPRCAAL